MIEKCHDPYDENAFKYVIRLMVPENISYTEEGEKVDLLDQYFKFKKVIFIKLKNDLYKK